MPIDETLTNIMDRYFQKIKTLEPDRSEAWIKMSITSTNLRGLANVLLEAIDQDLQPDLRQLALGILGTAAWLEPDDDI